MTGAGRRRGGFANASAGAPKLRTPHARGGAAPSHAPRSFAYHSEYRARATGGGERYRSLAHQAGGQGRQAPFFHMPGGAGGGGFHGQSFHAQAQPHVQAQRGQGPGGGQAARSGERQAKRDQNPHKH